MIETVQRPSVGLAEGFRDVVSRTFRGEKGRSDRAPHLAGLGGNEERGSPTVVAYANPAGEQVLRFCRAMYGG